MSKDIKNVRSGYRGRITILQGEANRVNNDDELRKLIVKIEAVQEKIKRCDEEILYSFSCDKEVTKELGDIDDYHEGIESLLQTLKSRLSSPINPSAPPCNISPTDISRVKLPKLIIKNFPEIALNGSHFGKHSRLLYINQQ